MKTITPFYLPPFTLKLTNFHQNSVLLKNITFCKDYMNFLELNGIMWFKCYKKLYLIQEIKMRVNFPLAGKECFDIYIEKNSMNYLLIFIYKIIFDTNNILIKGNASTFTMSIFQLYSNNESPHLLWPLLSSESVAKPPFFKVSPDHLHCQYFSKNRSKILTSN